GIPVLFDTLHHSIRNDGETPLRGLDLAMATWGPADGTPMVDYSTQDPARRTGAHAVTLDVEHFRSFVRRLRRRDVDVMLETRTRRRARCRPAWCSTSWPMGTPGEGEGRIRRRPAG
ncbi:MAG: hypothetical protein NTW05_20345, partial [Pseudonocardiales bacterium]|nr:hypothetical protein [Pseudonocardiales bacterium]